MTGRQKDMRTEKAKINGHQSCGAAAQLASKKKEGRIKKERRKKDLV